MKIDYEVVLAEVDPRRDDQPAVDRARAVAKAGGASVHLCVCQYLNTLAGGLFFDDRQFEESRSEYVENLEKWLGELIDSLKNDGIDATGEVVWKNPRSEALLEVADKSGADLLIRSATQHTRLKRVLLGATDWELIRRAPMTLWLAKEPALDADRFRALAAIDPTHDADEGADLDRRLLATANGLCRMFSGELHAVHAFQPGHAGPVIAPGAAMATAAPPIPRLDPELLEQTRESLAKRVLKLTREIDLPDERAHVLVGDTADVIHDFVDEHDIDVVVAGAVSRSWLERLIIGNTAERLLDSVDCDIVVVKPDGFDAGS